MMPSRYQSPKPFSVKKQHVNVKHISAPLKGLSVSSKLVQGDPLTATVLDNFVIEENQVKARAGTRRLATYGDGKPVETLIPWYGSPTGALAAASNGNLREAFTGSPLVGGFGGNDWSSTAFANLSQQDFTVMCNGFDGVWSWDGGVVAQGAPVNVAVAGISKANPAVVTVASIAPFHAGQNVFFSGLTGSWAVINGNRVIGPIVGSTFTLPGIDTTGFTGTSDAISVIPRGSLVKENVTANPVDTYVVPDQFQIVIGHMNRLFFADSSNLAVYYLPIQQKSGQVTALPLNALFKRGGSIRALATWSLDGGTGIDDQLVIFTTNGECAIYGGIPETNFALRGIYRFDAPMSKHCVVNYGGELYVLISTGLVPMSTMMRAETDQLGQSDRNVFSLFFGNALRNRSRAGWQAMLNPSSGRLIASMPKDSGYGQMVRFMPNPIWASWSRMPSRCWCWLNARMLFGSDDGKLYEMHPDFLNDDGNPIYVSLQGAWSNFGSPAQKQFKMLLPYLQSEGGDLVGGDGSLTRAFVDFRVDYDIRPAETQPDVSMIGSPGSSWDTADWDTATWSQGLKLISNWQGIAAHGRVGAPRLDAAVLNCTFALTGWDVLYENGSLFG